MVKIQELITQYATNNPSCSLKKDFYMNSSIWELNRISKKNPHISLIKKMLQDLDGNDWPSANCKLFVEGSLRKSDIDRESINLLRIKFWQELFF